jgi:mycothiol synthase
VDAVIRTATRADAAAIAALLGDLERADDTGEHWNVDDVREEMDNDLVDPAVDWLLVERDGRLVGASLLQPRAPADGLMRVALVGGVHPAFRRQGIGTQLVAAAAERARAHVAERGRSLRPVVALDSRPEDRDLVALAERAGMRPEYWSFAMEADLPRPGPRASVPAGFVVETWEDVDPDEIRTVHNRAFAGHRGWSAWSPEMWRTWVTDARHHRPAQSLLLRDEAGAIAAYLHVLEYDAAEQATGVREAHVSKVGTAPEHRRRGLASTLLALALDRAAEQGYDRAALDVDAHNETGALSVYERAGFTVVRRWVGYCSE